MILASIKKNSNRTMIKHYLKVALRNLMNFKVHSLISAICLAIGITCFSMMNYFIDAITGKVELSDNNKYSIRLSGASSQTAADIYLFKEDFDLSERVADSGHRYPCGFFLL